MFPDAIAVSGTATIAFNAPANDKVHYDVSLRTLQKCILYRNIVSSWVYNAIYAGQLGPMAPLYHVICSIWKQINV